MVRVRGGLVWRVKMRLAKYEGGLCKARYVEATDLRDVAIARDNEHRALSLICHPSLSTVPLAASNLHTRAVQSSSARISILRLPINHCRLCPSPSR